MKCDEKHLILYAVTDRSWLGEKKLVTQVEETLKGELPVFSLGKRNWTLKNFYRRL
ncbi:hypothetical protein [Aminipila terrae]|uniref:hypothetical protein n=1 Tax=Aminipila terrae TaxID=2697030 RepID=UPI002ED00D43